MDPDSKVFWVHCTSSFFYDRASPLHHSTPSEVKKEIHIKKLKAITIGIATQFGSLSVFIPSSFVEAFNILNYKLTVNAYLH